MAPYQTITRFFLSPPYCGVPVLVWVYALVCCLTYSVSGPLNGYLIGSDDHVRMMQVLDWINGAGWYDRLIIRVDPPDGFTTIWSRLVDIPIAAAILIGEIFTDQRRAALAASIIVPFIELGILFSAARYFARPLVGKNEANLIALFIAFTTVLNNQDFSIAGFHAGEASHHPWYIILNLLMCGSIGRIALGQKAVKILALSVVLMLAVGIEALPMIAIAAIVTALVSWHVNGSNIAAKAAKGLVYGAVGGAVLLPLYRPLPDFFTLSFADPSLLGPILVTAAALLLAVEAYIIKHAEESKIFKLALIVIAAIVIISLLIICFPALLEGPAAALTPEERAMAFREHSEARPLFDVAGKGWFDFICLSMPMLIAVAAGVIATRKAKTPRSRALALTYLGLTALACAAAQMISRFYHHAILLCCVWLLWLWQQLRARVSRHKIIFGFILFIVLCPLWLLFLPALDRPYMTAERILLFPALRQSAPEPCHPVEFGRYLNAHYNPNTLMMVPGGDSTRMLYYSNLKIDFLNLYPSHNKFIDNEVFYSTQDLRIAADIAYRHHIDLVALCPMPVGAPPLRPGEQPMLYERLQNGGMVDWLKPVNTGIEGRYMLFEVDKEKLADFLTQTQATD